MATKTPQLGQATRFTEEPEFDVRTDDSQRSLSENSTDSDSQLA